MDISKLDFNHIEFLAGAYSVSQDVFAVQPIHASPKKQKEIRKWINKTYIDGDVLPEIVLSFLDDSKSDYEFLEFFFKCSNYIKEHVTLKKQLFDKVAVDFSDDVKNAFLYLFETQQYCDNFEQYEDKLIFSLDFCDSFERKLVLHTSKEFSLEKYDILGFTDAQIIKNNNDYNLICVADLYNDVYEVETTVPINIPFNNATVEINIYRADRREFNDNPWETLSFLASDILEKLHLGEVYFNKKELELLPLLNELSALSLFSNLYDRECTDFIILKQYIKKYNLNHLIPLIVKVERAYKNKSSTYLVLSKLYNKLNESICESLWRELYELVSESQQEYQDKILFFDQDKLNVIRLKIEDYFHELGYEGNFPNFIKNGSIKGIRLEASYNQTYFLGVEKNVKSVVTCREIFFGDTLFIQFICGTALLKKDEDIIDIYSCCFNKKGRRLFKKFNWNTDDIDVLDQFIIIAAKRAECQKLTKNEKELLGTNKFSLKYFLLLFIFTGALFSVLMTAGVFLLLCLITALFDGFDGIMDMIKVMPWWLFLTISFVGFGGAMAFVDIKANSK